MEQAANKTPEDIRIEIKSFKIKMTGLKSLLGEIKNYWKASPAE